mgnify:CR=1 FL=1
MQIPLVKRITNKIKNEIVKSFRNGLDINQISIKFLYTESTITKHLKNILTQEEFKLLKQKNKKNKIVIDKDDNSQLSNIKSLNPKILIKNKEEFEINKIDFVEQEIFHEITPLIDKTDFKIQKEISSQPLKEINLPEIVYLVVDKTVELVPKSLREFPEWSFLPDEDLSRLALEIFSDKKSAMRSCRKNEKVIKVPNSKNFLLSVKFLNSKGISRIIFDEDLISI